MSYKKNRTGETNIANNGQKMTIIEYRNRYDIDIQFEDGTIVYKKEYDNFKKGTIKNPLLKTKRIKSSKSITTSLEPKKKETVDWEKLRIGTTSKATNGQIMTITKYINNKNIDVTFDDGTVVTNQYYSNFLRGYIRNPNNKVTADVSINEYVMLFYLSKLGFIKMPINSLKDLGFGRMELDAFHPDKKIAVEYDGYVHCLKPNTDERKDEICKKNNITLFRFREKLSKVSDYSICYCLKSDRAFSSDFEKALQNLCNVLSEKYGFNSIEINFEKDKKEIMNKFEDKHKISRLGEEFVGKKGEHCKIIRYINCNNLYIRFDDGTEKKTQYCKLQSGDFTKRTLKRNHSGKDEK